MFKLKIPHDHAPPTHPVRGTVCPRHLRSTVLVGKVGTRCKREHRIPFVQGVRGQQMFPHTCVTFF